MFYEKGKFVLKKVSVLITIERSLQKYIKGNTVILSSRQIELLAEGPEL